MENNRDLIPEWNEQTPQEKPEFNALQERMKIWDKAQQQETLYQNLAGALLDMFEQEGRAISPEILRKAFGLESHLNSPAGLVSDRTTEVSSETEELDLENYSPGYNTFMQEREGDEEEPSDEDFDIADRSEFDFAVDEDELTSDQFGMRDMADEDHLLDSIDSSDTSELLEHKFNQIRDSLVEQGLNLDDYEDFKRIWYEDGRSLKLNVTGGKVSFMDFEPEQLRLAKELLDAEENLEKEQKGMLLAETGVRHALAREVTKLRSTEMPEEWRSTKKERMWLLSRNLFMVAAVALVGFTTLSLAANAVGNVAGGAAHTVEKMGNISVMEFVPLIATVVVVWAMLKKSESLSEISSKLYGWFDKDNPNTKFEE